VGSLRGNIFVWLFIPVRLMGLHGVITHARMTGLAGYIWITGEHDSRTFIDSCWINNCGPIWVIQGWGGECEPYITNNIIRNNTGNGIQCNVGATPVVTHNLITGNGC